MQDDEQQIRDLVATWLAATEAGDDERVLKLIADDAVFLTPGAPPMRKPDFAAAQRGLEQVQLQMSGEIQEIRILGDWAYSWNRLKVVVTPRSGGAAVTRAGNVLSILHKQADGWVIIRDANMLTVIA